MGKGFVEIEFNNVPTYSVKAVIIIYALYEKSDIPDGHLRTTNSPHDLIAGSEKPSNKLRHPKMVQMQLTCNRNKVLRKFYKNNASRKVEIMRIEVFDYSNGVEHDCVPTISNGGLGKTFVHIKCKKLAKLRAKFLVKIYVVGDEREVEEIGYDSDSNILLVCATPSTIKPAVTHRTSTSDGRVLVLPEAHGALGTARKRKENCG